MSNYFYLVDMQNDRYFYLGKSGTAKYYLPFLAYLFQGKPIIIFGDETNEALYDKYCESEELSLEEFDIEKNDVLPQCNHNLLSTLTMSKVEFDEIFEKIDGKEIINLEDYIRYRYRPHVSTKKIT